LDAAGAQEPVGRCAQERVGAERLDDQGSCGRRQAVDEPGAPGAFQRVLGALAIPSLEPLPGGRVAEVMGESLLADEDAKNAPRLRGSDEIDSAGNRSNGGVDVLPGLC